MSKSFCKSVTEIVNNTKSSAYITLLRHLLRKKQPRPDSSNLSRTESMKIENKNGESTLPCLTPAVSLVGLENLLHQWTTIEDEDKRTFKTLTMKGLIPLFNNRISKDGILTLSKALAMSTTPIFTVLPFLVKKLTVFFKAEIASTQPTPFLKPNCLSDVSSLLTNSNKQCSYMLEIIGFTVIP